MSYNRGGHGRGGGMPNKPRGGGGPPGFGNDMPQQQFGFQQRNYPPQMIPPTNQPGGVGIGGPGQPMQQQPPQQHIPQNIQIPTVQQSRSFLGGMPSPSLVQSGSMPMMGYQGAAPSSSGSRAPFGPPIGPIGQGEKSHHDILRKHQEEYALKQSGNLAMTQAQSITPGTYIGMSSKHNNSVIPVLPRLNNPVP